MSHRGKSTDRPIIGPKRPASRRTNPSPEPPERREGTVSPCAAGRFCSTSPRTTRLSVFRAGSCSACRFHPSRCLERDGHRSDRGVADQSACPSTGTLRCKSLNSSGRFYGNPQAWAVLGRTSPPPTSPLGAPELDQAIEDSPPPAGRTVARNAHPRLQLVDEVARSPAFMNSPLQG